MTNPVTQIGSNTLNPSQAFGLQNAGRATEPQPNRVANEAELREVAENFESLFIGEMIRPVFDSMETDGTFGGGHGEKVFRSMMVDEYAGKIAKSGQVNIADNILRDLIQMQERAQQN